MLGYTLVRKDELQELRRAWTVRNRVVQCHRWFAGWKDLDIIWEYLLAETYFGDIGAARNKYASARNTDCYGKSG